MLAVAGCGALEGESIINRGIRVRCVAMTLMDDSRDISSIPIVPLECLSRVSFIQGESAGIRRSLEEIPFHLSCMSGFSEIFAEAQIGKAMAVPLLMRLPAPDTNLAFDSSLEARWARFERAVASGKILKGDAANLSLLGSEVRDCMACSAIVQFTEGRRLLDVEGVDLEARARSSLAEVAECFDLYHQRLSPAIFALESHRKTSTPVAPGMYRLEYLGDRHVQALADGLLTAIYGVGAYYGASVYDLSFRYNSDESNNRVQSWAESLGRPVTQIVMGTDTPDKINADISKLNEVDLGGRWSDLEIFIRSGQQVTADEIGFIVRSAERQKDLFLLYTGALVCGAIQDLEDIHKLDDHSRALNKLEESSRLLQLGLGFRSALLETFERNPSSESDRD